VRKVASGAVEFINIMHVKNIARVIEQLQELGVWVTGTSLEASAHIYTMDFSGPCAIVLGTEGEGLRELTAKKCDHLANIPMQGVTQSLNLSVCAGICLFEANRQRL
jgi:23S rRNA (guanosine2251-2'-O)-methyltransferase